ncbi:hypothetical protein G6F63_015366 [Rhizopus arrhizus]|nr:hypothetical protein G6F63_015366 [Rhizopus arrhizus]
MLDRIEQLMTEVKGVCDNIAHDLRTPLTRVRAQLYRMRQQVADGDPQSLPLEQHADAGHAAAGDPRLLCTAGGGERAGVAAGVGRRSAGRDG